MESVELIARLYAGWARGDWDVASDRLDPDIVVVIPPDLPDAGTYRGLEEMRGYMRGFLEPWKRITVEAEELLGSGDRVFAAVVQRGVGIGSGTETELRYFHLWTLSGDRIVRFEAFRDRASALVAAGIELA